MRFKNLKFTTRNKIQIPILIYSMNQLIIMIKAGICINDCMKEIANTTKDKKLKKAFIQIRNDLNTGSSLSEAFYNSQSYFDDITLSMVKKGENSGDLLETLSKLIEIQQEVWVNQQKSKKLIYYFISLILSICIFFNILMLYILPKFLIENIINQGIYFFVGLSSLYFLMKFFYFKSNKFRLKYDQYILKVYFIRKIVLNSNLAKFNLIFTNLLGEGLSVISALETAQVMIENKHLKNRLNEINTSINSGVSLSESFRKTYLYDSLSINMIHTGEETGEIYKTMLMVTDLSKAKFNHVIFNSIRFVRAFLILFIFVIFILLVLQNF